MSEKDHPPASACRGKISLSRKMMAKKAKGKGFFALDIH
jgi:hypothetical protein